MSRPARPHDKRRSRMVHTYLSTEEKRQVTEKAAQLKLTVSEFLRRLALNIRLPHPTDFIAHEAVLDILKINADQARLGNALMLELDALASDDVPPAFIENAQRLHDEIRTTQKHLKSTAVKISDSVNAGTHIRP